MRPLLALVAAAVLSAAIVGSAAAEEIAPAEPIPVLGAKALAKPFGAGFGTAEPETIKDADEPADEVSKIRWKGWGESISIGAGREPILKPGGGYYEKPVRVELRASELGRCGTKVAYTRLDIRAPRRPGGKLGKWKLWSGEKTICEMPH